MILFDEAIARIASAFPRRVAATERVDLADASGRVLAESITMDADMPPFRRSTMDGFAIRISDRRVGATLDVDGRITAGENVNAALTPGHAIRVMTGAPVPAEAEDVIPFEWTNASSTAGRVGEHVRIERLPRDGANIVERGSFYKAGAEILTPGTSLRAAHMGMLASVGRSQIDVYVRPRVSILPTGNELIPIDQPPVPGKIRNSNAYALRAQVTREGAIASASDPVGDDREALIRAIRAGLDSELLLLSGGVSKGDLDLVPSALEAAGVRCLFHGWALQPGGPMWCGVTDTTLVLGLPGNPAATFVGFELLGVPALRAWMGAPFCARKTLSCRHQLEDIGMSARRRIRPVRLMARAARGLEAVPLRWHGSGDPLAFGDADALAVLPANTPLGDRVDVIVLGPMSVDSMEQAS